MRVKIDPGQLDELDEEVYRMKGVLGPDSSADTGDLIERARCLMEETDGLLDHISHESGWERPYCAGDDEDDDDDDDGKMDEADELRNKA